MIKSDARRLWEMDKSEVEVLESFDGEIIGEKGYDFLLKFMESDGTYFEADLPKSEFKYFPHEVGVGTHFWVVVSETDPEDDIDISVWPIAKYWHESW